MRPTLILMFAMLLSLLQAATPADELNSNAKNIKDNYTEDYERTIRANAVKEWEDDFSMIIYEINNQADALTELMEIFKSDNSKVFYKAMFEWTTEGWEENNKKYAEEMKSMDLKYLLKLNCDWTMVLYEYKKQVKAKSAF